jgi:hypothetical protein
LNEEILNEDENPRKSAALALAERGFWILAVDPKDKRPDRLLSPSGFKGATRDPEIIAGWWDAKPRCNIGIACGPEYGLLVADVDVKNGANGLKTWQALDIDTMTLTANTPSSGLHLYFQHPSVLLRPKLDGIDLKGADGSGYVLAPPSALPNGKYTWRDEEIPIAPFPAHLLDRLGATGPQRKNGATPVNGPVASITVPEGRRHARLVELGAIYRGKGLAEDEIETLLWEHARRYFDPPFGQDNPEHVREIESVVRWYGGKEASAASVEPLTVLSTTELRQLAQSVPAAPLLNPPLPEAGSMMIYGSAGIGKSHVGICVAGALAQGRPFLDWTVPGRVPVLYVDGEMPLDELDTRIGAYFGEDQLEGLSWIAARAREADLPNLADPSGQELYYAAVCATGAKAVVFDNLSCLRFTSAEMPENSIEAWAPVGAFIRRLNRMGVAVIVVHHASKAGQQRGSTGHVAPMDTVLCLRALGEGQADPLAENDIEFVFEKHRRFGGDAAQTFRAKAIGDADGRVAWQRVGADPLVDDVVRMRLQGKSVREIAGLLKRSKNAIQKAVERAKGRGLLPLGGDAP